MKFLEFEYILDIKTGKGKIIHYLSHRERRRRNAYAPSREVGTQGVGNQLPFRLNKYVPPGIYVVETDVSETPIPTSFNSLPFITADTFKPRLSIMSRYADKLGVIGNDNRFV